MTIALVLSSDMSIYTLVLFPDLKPHMVDPLWFDVDRPVDMHMELKVKYN